MRKFQSCLGLGKTTCELYEFLGEIVDLKKYQNQWANEYFYNTAIVYRCKKIKERVKSVAYKLEKEYGIPFVIYDGLEPPYWSLCSAPEFVPNFPSLVYIALTQQPIEEETVRCILVPLNFFYSWVHVNGEAIESLLLHEVGHHLTWEQLTDKDLRNTRLRSFIGEFILEEFFADEHMIPETKEAYSLSLHHHMFPEILANGPVHLFHSDIDFIIYNQYDFVPDLKSIFGEKGLEYLATAEIEIDTSKVPVAESVEYMYRFIVDGVFAEADILPDTRDKAMKQIRTDLEEYVRERLN